MREYDLEDLRHQIGVIFQDFIRYDLTVKENIGLGQIEHVDNMNRIVHASEQEVLSPPYLAQEQSVH